MQVQSFHPQDLYYIKYHVCLVQFFFNNHDPEIFRVVSENTIDTIKLNWVGDWIELTFCCVESKMPSQGVLRSALSEKFDFLEVVISSIWDIFE